MKINRSGETLTIRETPSALWALGAFFALIGAVFVYGALGGYSNYHEASRFAIGAHLFFGLCGVAAGYWVIYAAPGTRIIIDRVSETVAYRKNGLAGRRETIYRFDDIEGFCVIEERDSENGPVWSLGLKLREGEVLKISALESPVEGLKRDFVFQANEFMYKQLPSYRDVQDET